MRSALALLVVLAGAPALAEAELVPVVIADFGAGAEEVRLLRAVELELQLVEELVVSDARELEEELGTHDVATADPERLADALARLEQQALIYAVPPPGAEGELVLAVFRTQDAAIVFARLIDVGQALKRPEEAVARDLAQAARALHQLARLGDDELEVLGLRAPAPVEAGPADDSLILPVEEPPAPAADRGEGAIVVAGTGELGRASLTLAPTFLFYRACQPEDPASVTPFSCSPRDGAPNIDALVNPLTSPLAGEAHLELYLLPWLGVEARGSALFARLSAAARGRALEALTPNPFTLFAGHGLVALNLRAPFGTETLGGAVGLRAGYHLAWAVAEEQELQLAERSINFPLFPSYASHNALLGASFLFALSDALRVTLDVDGLVGPHLEGPNRVGQDALALGGRAHLGFDVRLLLGLYASFFIDVSALSVGTKGVFEQAPRDTLALEPFDSGQVLLASARAGIGLGWRF